MAYSAALAARIRQALAGRRGVVEKKMFGGVGYLLHGNMCVGVWQQSLIVRHDPANQAAALALPHVRPFDITGRAMNGWVLVEPDGVESESDLAAWLEQAWEFVGTLPPKPRRAV